MPRGGFAPSYRRLFLPKQPNAVAAVVVLASWHDEPVLLRVRAEYLLYLVFSYDGGERLWRHKNKTVPGT